MNTYKRNPLVVILVCGRAGSGKDTFAQFLKSALDKFSEDFTAIIPNAETVKEIARDKFNWNGVKDKEGRQLLIDITEQGYKIDKFFWEKETYVKALTKTDKIGRKPKYVIIPDWRYESTKEYFDLVADYVLCFKVLRDDTNSTHGDHSSENNFKNFHAMIIDNNKDLDELAKLSDFLGYSIKDNINDEEESSCIKL